MGLIAGFIAAVGAIVTVATTIVKGLAIAGLAVEGIKKIGEVIAKIFKALGIIKPETTVDDLGDKALQAEAEGIKPEDYESVEDYIKAVESRKSNPELSAKFTEKEKIEKGTQLLTALSIEKYGQATTENFIKTLKEHEDYFNKDRTDALANVVKSAGDTAGDVLDKITGYINGTEKDGRKLDSAIDILTGLEKQVDPSLSDTAAKEIVLNI